MSSRPSNIYNKSTTCPDTETEYAVIGNTIAALMTVIKLVKAGVEKVNWITSTYSNVNAKGVDNLDFIPRNAKTILHYLISEKIHYTANEDCSPSCYDVDMSHYFVNRDVYYTHGLGQLGDMISNYILGHFGPWYHASGSNSDKIQPYVNTFTTRQPLNDNEYELMERLRCIWNIPKTDSVVVKGPSILCTKYILKKRSGYGFIRQLFKKEYNSIASRCGVNIHNLMDTLYFDSCTPEGNWNLSSHDWELDDVRVIYKTNPYSFMSVTSRGGLCPDNVNVPTFYRAVIPITANGQVNIGKKGTKRFNFTPIVNTDVPTPSCGCETRNNTGTSSKSSTSKVKSGCPCNKRSSSSSSSSSSCGSCSDSCPSSLSCNKKCEDDNTLLMHNTFSLPDLDTCTSQNSGKLTWTGQTYLVKEDFFPTDQKGWYASSGYNLLVVECACFDNLRSVGFDKNTNEISIPYNRKKQEEKFLYQFAMIVSDIILAHTGTVITPESLLEQQDFKLTNGISMEGNLIENFMSRESTLTTLLEMIAGIYGGDHYVDYGEQINNTV